MLELLRRLRRRNKRGTTFLSFEAPLIQLCRTLEFDTVIEFGPGHSTELFLAHTDAQIVSFETSEKWYRHYRQRFESDRVRIALKHEGWDLREIVSYLGKRTLVFVDGGDRTEALQVAAESLPSDGVVFLHDAHREDYEAGIRLFPHRFLPERHSCILFKSKSLMERVRDAIPSDYSCECQYCSSPSRRAYFQALVDSAS